MAEKRKYPVVPCPECGGHMKRARENQRRCLTCRLGKNAAWIDGRKAECTDCGGEYIPWGRKQQWSLCGDCILAKMPMGMRESVEAECAWHKKADPTNPCLSGEAGANAWVYSADMHICFPCLTDPAKYADNRQTILRKVRRLQARLNVVQ